MGDRCRVWGEKSVMGILRRDIVLANRFVTNGFCSVWEEYTKTSSVPVGVPGNNPMGVRFRVALRSVYIDCIEFKLC